VINIKDSQVILHEITKIYADRRIWRLVFKVYHSDLG